MNANAAFASNETMELAKDGHDLLLLRQHAAKLSTTDTAQWHPPVLLTTTTTDGEIPLEQPTTFRGEVIEFPV